MKAKPVKLINTQWVQVPINEATHVQLKFPLDIIIKVDIQPPLQFNILQTRYIPFQLDGTRNGTGNWSWNGDIDKPTLKPSILTTYQHGEITYRCHSFVNDGVIQFLSDCTHDKANTIIELMDVE